MFEEKKKKKLNVINSELPVNVARALPLYDSGVELGLFRNLRATAEYLFIR